MTLVLTFGDGLLVSTGQDFGVLAFTSSVRVSFILLRPQDPFQGG